MSAITRTDAQDSEWVQDSFPASDNLNGAGEILEYDINTKTWKKIIRNIYGLSKIIGEATRRRGAKHITGDTVSLTGTITNVSTTVTGSGTAFLTELQIGDWISGTANEYREVTNIVSDTSCTIQTAFTSTIVSGQAFKRRRFVTERLDEMEASTPSGYLETRIVQTSSTDITVYKGSVVDIQGVVRKLSANAVITGSGASKWYYLIATKSGVSDFTVSSLAVDAGHITANTQVYFPNASSTYSDTYNGHYSSNSRIICAYFWSGTAVLEVVPYDSGYFDPSEILYNSATNSVTATGYLTVTTITYDRVRGVGLSATTNGDIEITANRSGIIEFQFPLFVAISAGEYNVYIYKNGAEYNPSRFNSNIDGQAIISYGLRFKCEKGDVFKFYLVVVGGTITARLDSLRVKLYEGV